MQVNKNKAFTIFVLLIQIRSRGISANKAGILFPAFSLIFQTSVFTVLINNTL
jgi:hypothetical protein